MARKVADGTARHDSIRIGQRVVICRTVLGMRQGELASLLQVSKKHLSWVENGHYKLVPPGMIVALAEALDTTTDYLLTGRGGPLEEPDLREGKS